MQTSGRGVAIPVSNQLISLASREEMRTRPNAWSSEVSNQLISLASRESEEVRYLLRFLLGEFPIN